jgi:hypothetical protein
MNATRVGKGLNRQFHLNPSIPLPMRLNREESLPAMSASAAALMLNK